MRLDPRYVEHVLSDHLEDAKALFIPPLLAIHSAHLTARALASSAESLTDDRSWRHAATGRIATAQQELRRRVQAL